MRAGGSNRRRRESLGSLLLRDFTHVFFWDLMDVINGVLGFFRDQGIVSGEDQPEFGIHFSYTAGV